MGPAGFFQPSEKPVVISPLLAVALMKAVFLPDRIALVRQHRDRRAERRAGGIVQQRFKDSDQPKRTDAGDRGSLLAVRRADGDPAAPVVFQAGQAVPKVDVVLFEDCWMGTLETAFELQGRHALRRIVMIPRSRRFRPRRNSSEPCGRARRSISTFLKQANYAPAR